MIETNKRGEFIISGVPRDLAIDFCKRNAPWRMEVVFDDIRTSQFESYQPFNPAPLAKLNSILQNIPTEFIANGDALDIGCNIGYNSIYLANKHNMRVTGIDVNARLLAVASEIAKFSGQDAPFLSSSAETFISPQKLSLILHLGTLYHLANPYLSFQSCARSLKSGGYFALETMCYRGSKDPFACKWIFGLQGDKTNFWSLGEGAVKSMLESCGFSTPVAVSESSPAVYAGEHTRVTWIGSR